TPVRPRLHNGDCIDADGLDARPISMHRRCMRSSKRTTLIVVLLLTIASAAGAADSGPVAVPPPVASSPVFGKPAPSAQLRYSEGEALGRAQAWKQAETAYTEATKLDPNFAEAWNGLGHARKMQRSYPE